ncbi:MAG: ATP-binding cassette domain-containing protein [Oscillospiraceae bacterium]|nr:ATP-binding cassette domain-containing protein [Oscillospiraceae bacterium]
MISARDLKKSFGDTEVISGLSFDILPDEPATVTGASGGGKTTLLRMILGLEKADGGEMIIPEGTRFGVLFQEDRLFEGFDAVTNVSLATGIRDTELIKAELLRLLPEEALSKPVKKLSGGQRRRIGIVRAALHPADGMILDEPFSGLDAENAAIAAEYIREKARGRLLLMALHEKDVPAWCEKIIRV